MDTISIENEKAEIDMTKCVHCGTYHSVCREDAVRHDSEKVDSIYKRNTCYKVNKKVFMSIKTKSPK